MTRLIFGRSNVSISSHELVLEDSNLQSWVCMTLKELVKGKKVRFKLYRDSELWYETDDGFEFPVPIADTGTGIFKAEDSAIAYMRWIRKHLAEREEWAKERESQARNLPPNTTQ